MKICFQADADLDPDIGRGLVRQEPAIDWRPAQGFVSDATPDAGVLEIAAAERRVLVSRDVSSMPGHFAEFVTIRSSPGVVLIPPGTSVGDAIERLLVAWLAWTAEDLENQIRWLPA